MATTDILADVPEVYRNKITPPANAVAACNIGTTVGNTFNQHSSLDLLNKNDTIDYIRYDSEYPELMKRDEDMMRRLPPHQCLLKYQGSTKVVDGRRYLAVEKSDDSIYDSMEEINKYSFPEKMNLLTNIVLGIHHMHISGCAHRSLTLKNIVLIKDDSYKIRIHNLSYCAASNKNYGQYQYYSHYIKPKIPSGLQHIQVSAVRADIYSLGCIIHQIFTGSRDASLQNQELQDGIEICAPNLLEYQRKLVEHLLTFIFREEEVDTISILNHPALYCERKIIRFVTDLHLLISKINKNKTERTTIECFKKPFENSPELKLYTAEVFSHCYNTKTLESQMRCFRGTFQHIDEKTYLKETHDGDVPRMVNFLLEIWPDFLPMCHDNAYANRKIWIMEDYV